jgi:rfaE bifunctional protein kinase chain/domain
MLDKEKIIDAFEAFNKLKVLIIGDVMIDSYLWGKVERISPEAPVPIVAVNKRENRPGGAANVAINVQALGAEAILCSVIGNDGRSHEFFDLLKQLNLSSEGIIKSENRITTVKFRIIGNNSQMLRVDEEMSHDLNKKETESLTNKIIETIEKKKIDVIIFEDYNKGVITEGLIRDVITFANKKNIPVAVDPKKKNFNAFKNVTLFKPNMKELREGLKADLSNINKEELNSTIKDFQQKQNIQNILITLSEAGIFIRHQRNEKPDEYCCHLIPAHIRNIADVSGAGDTVISVASLCLALQLEPEVLASIANLAGGLVCEHLGAVPINKDLLLRETIKLLS